MRWGLFVELGLCVFHVIEILTLSVELGTGIVIEMLIHDAFKKLKLHYLQKLPSSEHVASILFKVKKLTCRNLIVYKCTVPWFFQTIQVIIILLHIIVVPSRINKCYKCTFRKEHSWEIDLFTGLLLTTEMLQGPSIFQVYGFTLWSSDSYFISIKIKGNKIFYCFCVKINKLFQLKCLKNKADCNTISVWTLITCSCNPRYKHTSSGSGALKPLHEVCRSLQCFTLCKWYKPQSVEFY